MFIWLTYIYFLVTLLWFVLFVTTKEQFFIVRWISYIVPILLGGLLISINIVLFLKTTYLKKSIFLLLPLVSYPYLSSFFPLQNTVTVSLSTYKIMTYSKMGRNNKINSVAQVIINEKPDILFMQEISEKEAYSLIKKLRTIYKKGFSFLVGKQSNLIFSRFKIKKEKGRQNKIQPALIALPEGNISVRNIHLQKSVFTTDKQYKILDRLVKDIKNDRLPQIIGGDFNATSINYPYIKIKNHLSNAFEQAGFGFGFTFPSPARNLGILFPFMRIDHIFYSNHFKIQSAYVVKNSGNSDHYPVIAILSASNFNMITPQPPAKN